jgi:adenine-specific DNA-methyltransferase
MKYMGSKRALLGEIRDIVQHQGYKDKAILDVFAGTCGVGMALRDLAPIYSNDIQSYSAVIADGCLGVNLPVMNSRDLLALLESDISKNYKEVATLLPSLLERSNKFKTITSWDDTLRMDYLDFVDAFASQVLENSNTNDELILLAKEYRLRQDRPRLFPYIQTTYLFSEMYFGLEQAILLDSIRFAIDELSKTHRELADALLAALVHAYSYTSAGTGHFAQFRDLSTTSSVEDVFGYRRRSVLDYFLRKAEEIIATSARNKFASSSRSFSQDYATLMSNREIMQNVGLIYADPPYSFVHYSRFYHATEDLCRYDYPSVEYKGRYRKDRYQSPFCIKTKAPAAFNTLFSQAQLNKCSVLVSYSNTGMISLETLTEIAHDNNFSLEMLELDHKHSTMGRLKDRHRDVKEALLLCLVN